MQALPLTNAEALTWSGVPAGGLQTLSGTSIRPWRLPLADLDLFTPTRGSFHHSSTSNSILTQAANASGVRIVLCSDTDRIRMVVQPRFVYSPTDFDLVIDNKLIDTRSFPPEKAPAPPPAGVAGSGSDGGAFKAWMQQMEALADERAAPLTVEFNGIAACMGGEAGRRQNLEIWLPHRATVTIVSLEVSATASIASQLKDVRPRWITHGSSITHCAEAHSPSRTWPATAARMANLNLFSLGFGGQVCEVDPVHSQLQL